MATPTVLFPGGHVSGGLIYNKTRLPDGSLVRWCSYQFVGVTLGAVGAPFFYSDDGERFYNIPADTWVPARFVARSRDNVPVVIDWSYLYVSSTKQGNLRVTANEGGEPAPLAGGGS